MKYGFFSSECMSKVSTKDQVTSEEQGYWLNYLSYPHQNITMKRSEGVYRIVLCVEIS